MNPVFGEALDDSVMVIPQVLADTVNHLQENDCFNWEGIFRLSGSKADIDLMAETYNSHFQPEMSKDLNAVAGLLKLYLRRLKEPVISEDLYEEFIKPYRDGKSPKRQLKAVRTVVREKLSPRRRLILAFLIPFLHKITLNSDENFMDSRNLGIIFGPCLLRNSALDPFRQMADSGYLSSSVADLIEHSESIFEGIPVEEDEEKKKEVYFPPKPPEISRGMLLKTSFKKMMNSDILQMGKKEGKETKEVKEFSKYKMMAKRFRGESKGDERSTTKKEIIANITRNLQDPWIGINQGVEMGMSKSNRDLENENEDVMIAKEMESKFQEMVDVEKDSKVLEEVRKRKVEIILETKSGNRYNLEEILRLEAMDPWVDYDREGKPIFANE